jgi:asparagine synthase (glutamine-hydrolysing)
MCGIVGCLNNENGEKKRELIARMAGSLAHRGPDGWGRYVCGPVALGHTRLSIIDLAGGNQPMLSEKSAIVLNGEIFNYIELRQELEASGARFATGSDTEVAQRAIETWGTAAIPKFNGQFAILFWDKASQELLAIRDRYGMLPLFFARCPSGTYFASEMKSFDCLPDFRRSWNPEALLTHGLFWNTLDESTVYHGISSLAPGSFAWFSPAGEKIRSGCYYSLGETSPDVPKDYGDACAEFRQRLQKSVDLRLRSDVPVGCYLSGGIDSSVTSLLARKAKGDSFKTFSVAFSDAAYDESGYQRLMAERLGSEHSSELVTADTIDANFAEAAYHFERPVFRTAPLPLFMLSRRVRSEGIVVVLTGEGADEVLCGYDVFKELKLLEAWNSGAQAPEIDAIIRGLYPHLAHYEDPGQLGFMRMYYEGFLDKYKGAAAGLAIRFHNNAIIQKYLNPDWGVAIDERRIEAQLEAMMPARVRSWPILKREQFLEMRTLMEGYLLSSQGDRMSMAHGVEGRYPFLDHEFVEWAFALPMEWKLAGLRQKAILRDAFEGLVPGPILDRPKQPYQAPDLAAFVRDGVPTESAAYFLDSKRVKEYGIFDPKMVERLLFKFARRGNEGIGYRDNMLAAFILSAQMAERWIREPRPNESAVGPCTVDIWER